MEWLSRLLPSRLGAAKAKFDGEDDDVEIKSLHRGRQEQESAPSPARRARSSAPSPDRRSSTTALAAKITALAAKDAEIESLRSAGEDREKSLTACLASFRVCREALAARDAQILRNSSAREEQEKKWGAVNACNAKARDALAAKDGEIARLGVAEGKLLSEAAWLRSAREEQEKKWGGVNACNAKARDALAAKDSEIARLGVAEGKLLTEAAWLRIAREEQEKKWRAVNACNAKARDALTARHVHELAAKDGEIARLGRAEELREKGWLSTRDQEIQEQASTAQTMQTEIERLRSAWASRGEETEGALAAKDDAIARLCAAKEQLLHARTEQEAGRNAAHKEIEGLRRAGEEQAKELRLRRDGEQTRQLLQADAESARAGLAGKEAELLRVRTEQEAALVAKDGEIARLGLAGADRESYWRKVDACHAKEIQRLVAASVVLGLAEKALAKEIGDLRRAGAQAGEKAGEKVRQLLQANAESARGKRAAMETYLLRVRKEQVAALADKDEEIARVGRAGEDQERGWRAELAARDAEIQRQGHSIDALLASEKAAAWAVAGKDDVVTRLGLAEGALSGKVAGLRRAGEEADGERRAVITARDAEMQQLVQVNNWLWASRDEAGAAIAGKDDAIARLGIAEGALAREVAELRRAGAQAGEEAGEKVRQLLQTGTEERQTLGKRWREEARELEGRVVKAKREQHEAEEVLEESRETLGYQIRATDSLMSKVDDLCALALAGGADATAVTAIKLRKLC